MASGSCFGVPQAGDPCERVCLVGCGVGGGGTVRCASFLAFAAEGTPSLGLNGMRTRKSARKAKGRAVAEGEGPAPVLLENSRRPAATREWPAAPGRVRDGATEGALNDTARRSRRPRTTGSRHPGTGRCPPPEPIGLTASRRAPQKAKTFEPAATSCLRRTCIVPCARLPSVCAPGAFRAVDGLAAPIASLPPPIARWGCRRAYFPREECHCPDLGVIGARVVRLLHRSSHSVPMRSLWIEASPPSSPASLRAGAQTHRWSPMSACVASGI